VADGCKAVDKHQDVALLDRAIDGSIDVQAFGRFPFLRGVMVRRRRMWVAGLVTVGLVFAQLVTAAHACMLAVPSSQGVATIVEPADETMPSDCAAMAKPPAAKAKVCVAHCTFGQQIDVQADAPVAAIAPQPALTVSVASSNVRPSLDSSFLHARNTAPPVSLLFSRFLI
jgi:hypothetical protein